MRSQEEIEALKRFRRNELRRAATVDPTHIGAQIDLLLHASCLATIGWLECDGVSEVEASEELMDAIREVIERFNHLSAQKGGDQ